MRPIAMHTLFLLFVALFLFNPIATNAEAPVGPPKEVPNKTDSGIYQYTGKDGVTVFTNNIDAVPLSQRRRTGVPVVKPEAEGKPKIEVKPEIKITQSAVRAGLHSPFIRNILLMIVAIVLFWIIKLWIKNMILKFIARIAIKAAIIGLVYMLAHQWFFSTKKDSFLEAVRETVAPYRTIVPIEKATEGIKEFNKKQEEYQKRLDAIQ